MHVLHGAIDVHAVDTQSVPLRQPHTPLPVLDPSHEGVVRGDRAERNGLKTITGDFGRLDRTTWKTLTAILEQPLPALTA